MKSWALSKYDKKSKTFDSIIPFNDRRICLFKEGENIMTCPICRMECAHDVEDETIKEVLAKIHIVDNGITYIHYILNKLDIRECVPKSEYINNSFDKQPDQISKKWAKILSMCKYRWENGNKNIYAVTKGAGDFSLTDGKLNITIPTDENGELRPFNAEDIKAYCPLKYKTVNVQELMDALN
jgi:hypothetical protein